MKVWDRRSIAGGRPAGVFLGHTEGLTYIDSKNDGRYILTNGKDQKAKLWDLRKVMSTSKAIRLDPTSFNGGWDYRDDVRDLKRRQHPHDHSVVTFQGHVIRRTLIRAHFSPPGSTDGQFIYSGSQDGKVYVWNMDSTLRTTLDVGESTTYLKKRPKELVESYWYGSDYQTLVRDASWHPTAPVIAATSWNGWGASLGTCTVHSWNDGTDEEDTSEDKPILVDSQIQTPLPSRGYRPRRR